GPRVQQEGGGQITLPVGWRRRHRVKPARQADPSAVGDSVFDHPVSQASVVCLLDGDHPVLASEVGGYPSFRLMDRHVSIMRYADREGKGVDSWCIRLTEKVGLMHTQPAGAPPRPLRPGNALCRGMARDLLGVF